MKLELADILHLCFSISCLLLLARAMRVFGKGFSFPAVVTELLLGILIGPTFLGNFLPEWSGWLFPVTGAPGHVMQSLSQLAVIMLLFVAGLETNLKALKSESKRVLPITLGSAVFPFLSGFLLVWLAPTLFSLGSDQKILLSSFMGIAFAISALPVIIRILMDIGLYRSRVGLVTVSTASLIDLLGWIAFTILLSFQHLFSLGELVRTIWSHSTLLAFLVGIVAGNSGYMSEKIKRLLFAFVIPILSPLFFLSLGAKVNFSENLNLVLILVVVLVSSAGKLLGTYIGGKLGGLNNKEALAVGFALNARGAMEIILSKQALEAGLIDTPIFVSLVILAILTSLLSAPVIRHLILKPHHKGENDASTFKATAEQVSAG